MSSMFRDDLLKGKRILVTGGGTGLGREMAEDYLRLGAEVYICGRRRAVLEATARALTGRHGGAVKTFNLDIRAADAVEEVVGAIWADGGPLTGLVNNAAGNFISPTEDISPRGFDAIAGIVLHGSFYVTVACARRWIAAGDKASVISILTTWIWTGGPFTTPSAMSKAGLDIMTKSLAAEWARHGIRLNAIAPGTFPTPGAVERLLPGELGDIERARAQIPMGRFGDMGELKNLASFLMADGADYLTGQTIAIDGALHLAGGGNYYGALAGLSREDWARTRARIRAADEADKAQRSV